MKILHIVPDLSAVNGGPVAAIKGLGEVQAASGHDVTVLSTGRTAGAVSIAGAEVFVYPAGWPAWKWSSALKKALPAFVRKADIAHLHGVWDYPILSAASACRDLGKPFILRPCGMLDAWSLAQSAAKKKIYTVLYGKLVLGLARAFNFTSTAEYRRSQAAGKEAKSFVCPLGVDLRPSSEEDRADFLRLFPAVKDKTIVLFLGRLHYKKQPEVAIGCFQKLAVTRPDLHLVMAGDGEPAYRKRLERMVAEASLAERVTFTGFLERRQVSAAFSLAAMFVLPSLQENFGLAVAEAMASGCPVVISSAVNLSDEVSQTQSGMVCEPSEAAFFKAMSALLSDSALSTRFRQRGYELASQRFAWSRTADTMNSVYEDILSGRRSSPAWVAG